MSSARSSSSPLTAKLVARHGRLGDRLGPVEVLPVGAAGLQVVAEQPRRAAHAEAGGRAVLDERALGAGQVVRPEGRAALEPEVLAHAARLWDRVRDERLRHRQVDALPTVQAEEAHPGRDQAAGDPLRGDDQLVVGRQCEPFGIEGRGRERQPGRVEERRHVGHDHVAGIEVPVRDVEREGVVPSRVDDALVVRDDVVAVGVGVVGDGREAADLGALELQARGQDLLPEELERRRRGCDGRGQEKDESGERGPEHDDLPWVEDAASLTGLGSGRQAAAAPRWCLAGRDGGGLGAHRREVLLAEDDQRGDQRGEREAGGGVEAPAEAGGERLGLGRARLEQAGRVRRGDGRQDARGPARRRSAGSC